MSKSKIIFWVHWGWALVSHILVILVFLGLISLTLSSSFPFLIKGLLIGITFFVVQYGVNHITNPEGFCFLTDIENFYRKQENLPEVGPFTPRFYKKCREIGNRVTKLFRGK